MDITKDILTGKLAELKKQEETLRANINAVEGARQMVNQMLAHLDKPSPDEVAE